MQKTLRIIEQINHQIGLWIGWASLAMVLVTFLVVVLRYVFDIGWIAMQESVTYLHSLLFMCGAAFTLQHHGHVRVDILYQRFSPLTKAWVELLGTLFLLFPVCGFLFWISLEYVIQSWSYWEGSQEAGGLPLVWLLKSLIPLMALLLMLQGTATLLRCVLFIRGITPRLYDEVEQQGNEI